MKKPGIILITVILTTVYCQQLKADFPVCADPADQQNPSISGNIIVWEDWRNGSDIYGYELSTNTEFVICGIELSFQFSPSISGDIVVWVDDRHGNGDIYCYDLSTSTEFPICTDLSWQSSPSISGDIVVWGDGRNGNHDIYGYDLATSTEFPICTDLPEFRASPLISGDIVVWEDFRNGDSDIYGYDLSTSTEFAICTDPAWQYSPSVSGDIVVWRDERNNFDYFYGDIYGYDLSTSTEFAICTDPSDQSNPSISGDIVVWRDYRDPNSNGDIYGYDLSTSTEFSICTDPSSQWSPSISEGIVVWTDDRNGNFDIYASRIVGNDECSLSPAASEGVAYGGTTIGFSGTDVSGCGYNDLKDVWFRFNPEVTGEYTISTAGSEFDTTLSVFDACGGNELACNDDYFGPQSLVVVQMILDKNYYIRLAGFNGDAGNYLLNVTQDNCMNPWDSDLNDDCIVDFLDFSIFADDWLKTTPE